MPNRHEEWMRRAIELAVENVRSGRGGPFGALVVKDERVIGAGANLVTATNDPTAHAEIVAIREACRRVGGFQLEGCTIYASCEPCPMCLGAIYWARAEAFYFAGTRGDAARAGFDDALIYAEINVPSEERSTPGYRVLETEGETPFIEWTRSPNRVAY